MNLAKKIGVSAVAVILVGAVGLSVAFYARGNLKKESLSDAFRAGIAQENSARTQGTDARVMSANLLVHYASWGGEPAKPRAKMFVNVLDTYQPDVVGLQEVSGEWFCCLAQNLRGSYKFLFPVETGMLVHFTSMIYNENTVKLVAKGQQEYTQGDNPRLRRVVWGVFESKASGKRFAVTSTHFDLIREEKEEEQFNIMSVQADEVFEVVKQIQEEYNCPVFATGDYNAMEDGRVNGEYDAPKIYEKLVAKLTDTKTIAAQRLAGDAWAIGEPTYDHIFLQGNAKIDAFQILSQSYLTPMSDHYPIFIDADLD